MSARPSPVFPNVHLATMPSSRSLQGCRCNRRHIVSGSIGSSPTWLSGKNRHRASKLRELLSNHSGMLLGPAVYDGISAKLTERAGFDFAFMSGFSVAGARLGYPDTGLLSFAEVLDTGRCIHEATESIPIIGDGDTGYGNALNVKRTVKSFSDVGFAGILIEDQMWPKSCGHVRNKRVIDRAEAVMRIRAACDARDEVGDGIVIVARTDARQADSLEEALWRVKSFVEEGADVVFIDALESLDEMQRFCDAVPESLKMASLLEGGGKTPVDGLGPKELEEMGFKLVAYPLSLLGVSIAAQQEALEGLRRGALPKNMPLFKDLQSILGFDAYFEEEAKYTAHADSRYYDERNTIDASASSRSRVATEARHSGFPNESGDISKDRSVTTAVEADAVLEPEYDAASSTSTWHPDEHVNPKSLSSPIIESRSKQNDGDAFSSGLRPGQWLRIRISDSRSETVKLDTRFPAGFIGNLASLIPQIAGLDLEGLLRRVASGETYEAPQPEGQAERGDRKGRNPNDPILSFETDGDKIDIFLEG